MTRLTWLADTLRGAGLRVREQANWQTRGDDFVFSPAGVVCHHTAGPPHGNMPSLDTVVQGRSDLPGPLSQLCLGRDGTCYVVASGRANHAGPGMWMGVTSGNGRFIGIEAENTGEISGSHGEPWPAVQMEAYRRGVTALLSRLGVPSYMCCGHKEYALPVGRKPDPTFEMHLFRLNVFDLMRRST